MASTTTASSIPVTLRLRAPSIMSRPPRPKG